MTNVDKSQLRQSIKAQLLALTPDECAERSTQICGNVSNYINAVATKKRDACTSPPLNVASFAGNKIEPDLTEIHQLSLDVNLLYPLCTDKGFMQFHHVADPNELLIGKYGIREPNPSIHPLVEFNQIDILLCPAMAFTRSGDRLGKGGGYYDRYLAQFSENKPELIGVCFDLQIITDLPTEPHDYKVDSLISETDPDSVKSR